MNKISLAGMGAEQLKGLNEATKAVTGFKDYSEVTDPDFPMINKEVLYGKQVLVYFPRVEEYVYTSNPNTIQGAMTATFKIKTKGDAKDIGVDIRYAPEFLQEPFKAFAAQYGFTSLETFEEVVSKAREYGSLLRKRLMAERGIPESHQFNKEDKNDPLRPVNEELKTVVPVSFKPQHTFTAPVVVIELEEDKSGRMKGFKTVENEAGEQELVKHYGWMNFSATQLEKIEKACSAFESGELVAGNYFLFNYKTKTPTDDKNFRMNSVRDMQIVFYTSKTPEVNTYLEGIREELDAAMSEWTLDKMIDVVKIQRLRSDQELDTLLLPVLGRLNGLVEQERKIAGGEVVAIETGATEQPKQLSTSASLQAFELDESDLPF